MIKSLLVANRGEIAIRVMRTARRMGIKTFAVRTSKEPSEPYLSEADEVIDFPPSAEDIPEFLDIETIVSIAKQHHIDAIHPGYGFLAENPYFAKRCEEENIIFIGPSPDAIYKMGNKTIAKQLAGKHNIPLLQGSYSSIRSFQEAEAIAEKIGYPVILKAEAGGGGRGMRVVERKEDLERLYKTASKEAEKAFKDASLFIEKYVRNPRHIEFQIVGDRHGNYVHLGERECSIQRKHQKLIEEAPSVALTPELRERMGADAIKVAKAVNYYSLGTVEFLLDSDNNYYFMEMNTRIQVEHPVTEMVTGFDLVELQIRIANGEPLSIRQEQVNIKGWAIECRINAEDVQANFAPSLGVIEKVIFPQGEGIRIDTGIREGTEITPYFDSMIAKLIVYAGNREKAIENALQALRNFNIKGIKTTIPFCKAVLSNTAFREGRFNTSFIESELKELFYREADEELLAAWHAAQTHLKELKEETFRQPDYEKGKNLSPWVLNKRIQAL